MMKEREIYKSKSSIGIWQYLKKNSFTIFLVAVVVLLIINPNAKSFLLRQLMATGLFNASINKDGVGTAGSANTDFDFADEKGNVQNTAIFRGKVVFINFWASWCPPCRAEFPSIEKLYSQFKNNPHIVFLAINEDNDFATGKAYLVKENFSVPIFRSQGNIPDGMYAGSLPTTIVLDKYGKVRLHHTGFANYASNKFVSQIKELINEP